MSSLLRRPDGWTYGLDYVRISYDVADHLAPHLDRMARRRADELGKWCYKNEAIPATQIMTVYGNGWRVGRAVSVVVHRYRPRLTEIVSGVAARHWEPTRVMMLNPSITRVDVAIDLDYGAMPNGQAVLLIDNIISSWYDGLAELKRTRAGVWARRAITYLGSSDGGSTVYVNRRTSGTFVRIYNKTADLVRHGAVENRAILRVELEIKGRGIKRIADPDYLLAGDVDAYVQSAVGYLVNMLELKLPDAPDRKPYYNDRLDPSEFTRSLDWIRRAVVPTLHRLTGAGYDAELRDLGITYTPAPQDEGGGDEATDEDGDGDE